MAKVDAAAMVIVLIGALNWGLIGLFDFDIIGQFLENEIAAQFAYLLIGAAALFKIIYFWTGKSKIRFND